MSKDCQVKGCTAVAQEVVMAAFVLRKQHLVGRVVMTSFVCGDNPRRRSFHGDVEQAKHFPTPDAALAYRTDMPRVLGGTAEQYRVQEILANGELLDTGL
jgi:hypothetical protein